MAAMYSRTDPFAQGIESSWSELHEVVKGMEEQIQHGERSTLPSSMLPGEWTPISSKETQFPATNARPLAVEAAIQMAAPLIWRMNMAFFQAPQGSFFVTSDNPCVWFSPSAYRLPPYYRAAGLAMEDIEITMPVTPAVLVLVSHNPIARGYFLIRPSHVDEFNRRTVAFSDKQFVSRTAENRPIWFERRTPPPDAWENRPRTDEKKNRSPFEADPDR
jgi:hypothetical protein